jgi:predicted nucleotide-binding protein (sugar kinase/HSP70/actin superfamily)
VPAFRSYGYNLVIPEVDNKQCIDTGLRSVNNDACYPSLIVIGQIMSAVLSGDYDLDKTAIIITQTGGGCRASNYIGFIRRSLEKCGFLHVGEISLPDGSPRVAYEKVFA